MNEKDQEKEGFTFASNMEDILPISISPNNDTISVPNKIKGNVGLDVTFEGDLIASKNSRVMGSQIVDGPQTIKGVVNAQNGLNVANQLVTENGQVQLGNTNRWTLHTPNDGRKTLYVAPRNAANTDWNWGKAVTVDDTGNVGMNGDLTAAGNTYLNGGVTIKGNLNNVASINTDGGVQAKGDINTTANMNTNSLKSKGDINTDSNMNATSLRTTGDVNANGSVNTSGLNIRGKQYMSGMQWGVANNVGYNHYVSFPNAFDTDNVAVFISKRYTGDDFWALHGQIQAYEVSRSGFKIVSRSARQGSDYGFDTYSGNVSFYWFAIST